MVTVDKFISVDPIGRDTTTTYTCNQCGRRCDQGNTRTKMLWWYGQEQLCVECLLEAQESDGIIEKVE